jgi:Tfp pilus assembly protein FimV
MNAALILSALLLGAAPMGSTGDATQMSPMFAPPTSDLPLPPIQDNTAQQKKQTPSQKQAQQRKAERAQARGGTSGYAGRYQQTDNQNARPVMPFAPTETSSGTQIGQTYQWLPPTANASAGQAETGGRPTGLSGPMSVPTSPTRGRPDVAQSYTSRRIAEQQNLRMQAARNAASAAAPQTPKPFSGAAQPTPGVSPYMNLFRSGNANGTIDNYTTLVRPELDQRRANQRFGADIHGLENSTHVQGLSIQQLNRETRNLQGVNATQYFMNYGDYYPGAR